MLHLVALYACVAAQPSSPALPIVELSRDNTVIQSSCRVRIAPGARIDDSDGNGVLQVGADGVVIEFEPGSVLRGADVGEGLDQTPWDKLRGVGVRLDGHRGVTIRGLRVEGYHVGVYASGCDGLTIEDAKVADIFRQHLGSTPQAEDSGDWLWPHENDGREWMTRYGGGVVVERAAGVTLRGVRVRRAQNGIILDRVTGSRVEGCDCSFLSGWGLAMWRSSDNAITRNALDFCVRGHSEGVYNRGQDSAGVLLFEGCQRNVFEQNSVTHGGDGIFGFAGKEAIGETPAPDAAFDYAHAGCANNKFLGNDLSYAVAHGLELTFSDGALVAGNRFVENAICGIWGGYSNSWRITGNTFEGNGGMGYGPERGAINMEHAGGNVIDTNTFINNAVAAHFWWDDDGALLQRPGVRARYLGPRGNAFVENLVRLDGRHPAALARDKDSKPVVLRLRDAGAGHVSGNIYGANRVELSHPRAVEVEAPDGALAPPDESGMLLAPVELPDMGACPRVAPCVREGREAIIMGEWGPWDHEGVFVRPWGRGAFGQRWQVFSQARPRATLDATGGTLALTTWRRDGVTEFDVGPGKRTGVGGVAKYTLTIDADGQRFVRGGTIIDAAWEVRAFASKVDPIAAREEWRALAANGVVLPLHGPLDLALGWGGPGAVPAWAHRKGELPGGADYGLVATTRVELTKGVWRLTTLSDDGVCVIATRPGHAPETVIERWTHHGPTEDAGTITLDEDGVVELRVEYCQLDGFAVLRLGIEPQP